MSLSICLDRADAVLSVRVIMTLVLERSITIHLFPTEMGPEFKKSMEVYVKRVVDSAAVSVKSGLTCASLAEKIKVRVRY